MNIAYDEIIERANARKDALQRIEALLNEAPRHIDAMYDASMYGDRLHIALKALDHEGRQLMGMRLDIALKTLADSFVSLRYNLTRQCTEFSAPEAKGMVVAAVIREEIEK